MAFNDMVEASVLAGRKRLLAEEGVASSSILEIVDNIFESACHEPFANKFVVSCPYIADELLHRATEDSQSKGTSARYIVVAILRDVTPRRASFSFSVAANSVLCLSSPFEIHADGRGRKGENLFVNTL